MLLFPLDEDEVLSSPIHRSEDNFNEESTEKENSKPATCAALGRLKALANTRNQWDDDITSSSKVRPSFFYLIQEY